MPTWKKIIVSGSAAHLSSVTASAGAIIAGSLDVTGIDTLILTGSIYTSGSNRFIGNQTISGSTSYSGSITRVDYITFDTTGSSATQVGTLAWDSGAGTLNLGLVGGNVNLLLGEALYTYVYNAEATTLARGEVVYVSGSQGNALAVKRASSTAEEGSANTLGIVSEAITSGGQGYVITEGALRKMNTTGLTAGSLLYVSSSAGQYTQTKPVPPENAVRLGYVQRVHSNQGIIYVKVDNGYEIDELHDVLINSSTSGDLLVKSGSLWINTKQLTGSYGLTGSLDISGSLTINGSTFTSGTSGASGSSGTSGTSGDSGSSGTSGNTGSSGTSGNTGSSGTSGNTGSSGTSGNTGSSGTSGVSGSNTLSASPGNNSYSGPNVVLTAAENLSQWDVVYINGSSQMAKARADVIGTADAIGIASAAITVSTTGTFVLGNSFIQNNSWTWTPGGFVYLSAATAGAITQTAPSSTNNAVVILGVAFSATVIYFNPQLVIVEVA